MKPRTFAGFLRSTLRGTASLLYWPFDYVCDNFAGMGRNTLWFADETGYTVHVRHGIRVVHRFRLETGDLPLAEIRTLAAARAVELALEHKIDLREVREAREPLVEYAPRDADLPSTNELPPTGERRRRFR